MDPKFKKRNEKEKTKLHHQVTGTPAHFHIARKAGFTGLYGHVFGYLSERSSICSIKTIMWGLFSHRGEMLRLPVNGGLWGRCVPVEVPGMSICSSPCMLGIGGIIVGGGIWRPGRTEN
uniref:Uncharacterized protein n=1 Tax=Romanomermis culicivorax TaxID=13658 RepID=A0A915J0A7_ROMCU